MFAVSCSGFNKLLKSDKSAQKLQKGIELYDAGKYSRATTMFTDIVMDYDGQIGEDTVIYYLGASYYKSGDFTTSGEIFNQFRMKFIQSAFSENVEYMYAKGFYFMSPPYYRDQDPTFQALGAIDEYLSHYPNSVKKEDLQANILELWQKLYDKSFHNARLYYKTGSYNSAVIAFRTALDDYPDTPHREEIYYLIVCSNYEYAKRSHDHLQRSRYMNMQDAYYSFISDYPESKFRKDADRMHEEAGKYLAQFINTAPENGNQEE